MKVLFIVAQEGYQDLEYEVPKAILEDAGIKVITASKKAGIAKGKFGGVAQTISLSSVNVADYDAVVFIGGPGAVAYQHDPLAEEIAQETLTQEKILAAICIAPTILAYAGVLKGKKATVWNDDGEQAKILEKNGAVFTDETITLDGNILTANGPPAAKEFGKKLLSLLRL